MDHGTGFELGSDGPLVIVAGTDGSPTSLRAAAYAAGLARRQGSELVVVFVATVSGLAGLAADAAAVLKETMEQMTNDLRLQVDEGAERIGVRARFVPRSGDPFTELSRVAEEVRADAVVVGASTKAGHRLIGSLAVRLVRAGKWPVTVVP